MRIYVIRHGQSEANRETAHAGWSQVRLTEKGIAQARAMQPRLQELRFDKIIVSDLRRAKQTAENALPRRDYVYDWRIREIGVGRLAALADNCSVSVFTFKSGKWILNKWNETGSLIPEA